MEVGGCTLAHLAAREGQSEILKVLKELGADLNAKDSFGRNSAHFADNFETLQILKELGTDTNAKDVRGRTPADTITAVISSRKRLLGKVTELNS